MFRIEMTHDVDHLGLKDHLHDGGVLRFRILCVIGLLKRWMSPAEFLMVTLEIRKSLAEKEYDTWSCVQEWLELEARQGIRSTWFLACRPGRRLAYLPTAARSMVDILKGRGLTVGLHSQCRDNPEGLADELAEFRRAYDITGPVPLRFHYLAAPGFDPGRYSRLFSYDSSIMESEHFFDDDDFERHLNIMDGTLLGPIGIRSSARKLMESAKNETLRIVDSARAQNRGVMFDVHHRSLSRSLPRYREYVLWLYQALAPYAHIV